ncbi:hypothetical protein PORY_001833 [Pneumocystis oryctolagi]|uniref:Uncharacterized protein n=1 Tax=Pneumocystis oryctolagi TaxID=42067 RepID=A0ACB7CCL6_9ASCO|nr:hypothetical protein PORY_001833 [Pneumocystis oryctolagi]
MYPLRKETLSHENFVKESAESFERNSTFWDRVEEPVMSKWESPWLDGSLERVFNKEGDTYMPPRLYGIRSSSGRSHTNSSCSSEMWADESLGRSWALEDELRTENAWGMTCETLQYSKNTFPRSVNGSEELHKFPLCMSGTQAVPVHGKSANKWLSSSLFSNIHCKSQDFRSLNKHSSSYTGQQINVGSQISLDSQICKYTSSSTSYPGSDVHNDTVNTALDTNSVHSKKASDSSLKPGLYKTELCKNWEESRECRYGLKCQFAHGHSELRSLLRHPKYKTSPCKTFTEIGSCPYGQRCCFSHIREPIKSEKTNTTQPSENAASSQTPLFLFGLSNLTDPKKPYIKTLDTASLLQKTLLNQDLSEFSHLFGNINLFDEISPLSLS